MTEKHWQFYTAATAVIAVLVSVYCLSEDITGIFVHLYYIPILIASYQYRERGLLLSLFLVMVYLLLVFFYFPGNAQALIKGCIRALRSWPSPRSSRSSRAVSGPTSTPCSARSRVT